MGIKKFKNKVSSKAIECGRYSASVKEWRIKNKQVYERNKY